MYSRLNINQNKTNNFLFRHPRRSHNMHQQYANTKITLQDHKQKSLNSSPLSSLCILSIKSTLVINRNLQKLEYRHPYEQVYNGVKISSLVVRLLNFQEKFSADIIQRFISDNSCLPFSTLAKKKKN